MTLQERIDDFFSRPADGLDRDAAMQAFHELKFFLNDGDVRAAYPSDDAPGGWGVNAWVKKGILLGFRLGELTDQSVTRDVPFFDKSTFPLKRLSVNDGVRLVPGGSSVRDGAYVAKGVVIMPPSYVNVGAYVDEGTMIDSHALVGSCAQVGKRVHLSAGAQIGGVLEPVGAYPVIVEDDVFVGGHCGVFEGTIVKTHAVLGAGVILTASTPVYDLVRSAVYRRTEGTPLVIPEGAVVIPGSRHIDAPFARQHHIAIACPVIIKYRDAATDAATTLEESLR